MRITPELIDRTARMLALYGEHAGDLGEGLPDEWPDYIEERTRQEYRFVAKKVLADIRTFCQNGGLLDPVGSL